MGRKLSADIITGVRQAVQDFIAPGIEQLRGDIRALDARIIALEKTMEARFGQQDVKFDLLNSKLDALINLHNLEVRVARLESRNPGITSQQ